MDPALRQRLIGAAVLILLAVIFVPMLLDGPPPEVDTREVSLDIPPQPTETRRLPVEPSSLPPAATNDAPATSDEDAVGMVQRPAEPAVSTVIPTPVLDEAPPPVEPTTAPPTTTTNNTTSFCLLDTRHPPSPRPAECNASAGPPRVGRGWGAGG